RLRNRFVAELRQPAHERMIQPAAEARVLLIAQAHLDERRLLEIVGEVLLGLARAFLEEVAENADHLEGLVLQVVRLLRVKREDLPGHLALRYNERRDRFRAEPAHRRQAMAAVWRPKAVLRRRDGNDRVQKHAGAVD